MKITQQQLRQIIKEEAEAHFAETHGKHHRSSWKPTHVGANIHAPAQRHSSLPAMGEPDPELAWDEDAAGMMSRLQDDPGFDDLDADLDEDDEMVDLALDDAAADEAMHEGEEEEEGAALDEGEEEEEGAAADEALNESRWSKLAGLNG